MPAERVAVGVLLAVGTAAGVTACGAVLGIQDPIPVGADASDASDASDAVPPPVDAPNPTDTGAPKDVVPESPYDAGPCPAVTPDPMRTIFVSTAGMDLPNCGSEQAPCASVQQGVSRARTLARPSVFVDRGMYLESVQLAAGVTVQGGWDDVGGTWTINCDPTATVIQAPPTNNVTIKADTLGGSASLDTLTVLSKADLDVNPGESLYGIMAVDATTTLSLSKVLVTVADGGPGTAGSVGNDGSPGGMGCSAADGSNGSAGTQGIGATTGLLSRQGYGSLPGGGGGNGGNGNAGTAPAFGPTCVACGSCSIDPLGNCNFTPDLTMQCGSAGGPGCGGGGASGGGGGSGGGSSFALFAWDATVTITGGSLTAKNGGAGGAGGFGGGPGAGAAGFAGSVSVPCFTTCDSTCAGILDQGLGGGAGGTGGSGGAAGQGGGGAGGWSYALARGGNSTVMPTGTQLAHGMAGAGAPVGGASGNAGNTYP